MNDSNVSGFYWTGGQSETKNRNVLELQQGQGQGLGRGGGTEQIAQASGVAGLAGPMAALAFNCVSLPLPQSASGSGRCSRKKVERGRAGVVRQQELAERERAVAVGGLKWQDMLKAVKEILAALPIAMARTWRPTHSPRRTALPSANSSRCLAASSHPAPAAFRSN